MFHENWYGHSQCLILAEKAKSVEKLEGLIIEIGCWEGKSTVFLANAVYPQEVIAVDTWQGNYAENPNHSTVILARDRDIFSEFQRNIKELTKNNVVSKKMDCFDFLSDLQNNIKFCHVDASHDYPSVKRTLEMALPKLIPGGIICGDDYLTGKRKDLQGGVQRAVIELCPGHEAVENFWWLKK